MPHEDYYDAECRGGCGRPHADDETRLCQDCLNEAECAMLNRSEGIR